LKRNAYDGTFKWRLRANNAKLYAKVHTV